MPSIHEAHLTQSFSADGKVVRMPRTYNVLGTGAPDEVYELVVNASPLSYLGMWRESIGQARNEGGGKWSVDVIYATIDPQHAFNPAGEGGTGGPGGGGAQPAPTAPGEHDPLGQSFSGDTTGGRARITQSIRPRWAAAPGDAFGSGTSMTVTADSPAGKVVSVAGFVVAAGDVGFRLYAQGSEDLWGGEYLVTAADAGTSKWTLNREAGSSGEVSGPFQIIGTAPGFGGAIGVSGDRVEGVEVPVPVGKWSRSMTLPFMTMAYYKACKALVGKVNNAPWYNFPAESVLYLGKQFTPGQGGRTQVTHFFHDEDNLVAPIIAPGIEVPTKKGHDYVWVRYKSEEMPGTGIKIEVPAGVYVDVVHQSADFTILGLG